MAGVRSCKSRDRSRMLVVLPSILLILLTAICACGESADPETTTSTKAEAPTTVSTTSTTEEPTTTDTTASTSETVEISNAAAVYAEDIGGTSHRGQTLFFVVGASVASEEEARTLLDEALPSFGDMQPYFIVQNSSNFEGMEPGRWVIIEAYRDEPSSENLDFGRRGFPDAQVVEATVLTEDPIPVYEELMGL